MPVNRFWRSVGSVAAFLFAVGLLQIILLRLLTLFGFVPGGIGVGLTFRMTVVHLVPVIGTFLYLDWRWGWGPEHIGLPRHKSAFLPGLLGLLIGMAAAVVAHLVGAFFAGGQVNPADFLPRPFAVSSVGSLVLLLAEAFAVELVFRGVVISRYQADLDDQEAVLAGTLTPFAWAIIAGALLGGFPSVGISSLWEAAMSVALSLLYLRFNSVWLTFGLRFGMMLLPEVLRMGITERGGFLVWGIAAAVLVAMEWNRLKHLPRPMGPRRNPFRPERTWRGPWGPH